jgi:hypothetical protein
MAVKTRTDLINQALDDLGLIAAGQDPAPEDNTAMAAFIDPLLAELSARDLPQVDDPNQIPLEWFLPLAILLADQAASKFGLGGVPSTQANPDPVASAEKRLREVSYSRPTYEPQRTSYF